MYKGKDRTLTYTGERGQLSIQGKGMSFIQGKPSRIQGKTKTPLSRETNNTTIS